ncbi:MAG TPA: DUF5663 domain-containing protein [Candidatus Paceibacterota bacterium]
MESDTTLEAFVERLITEKQFENLEPEVREQLKSDLVSRAEDHVNASVIAALSETDLAAFQTMLAEDKDAAALQAFLSEHVKDMDQVVAGALIAFQQTYLGKE